MMKYHNKVVQKMMMNSLEAVTLGIQILLSMNSLRNVKNQKNLCVILFSFR